MIEVCTNTAAVYRDMRPSDAASVAELHRREIDFGFLSALGPGFLRVLYRGIALSNRSCSLVAEVDCQVAGFAVATDDVSLLYRDVLRRHFGALVVRVLPSLIRRGALQSCWETLHYPKREEQTELPKAELLSIAIKRAQVGRGIGTNLLRRVLRRLWDRGVPAVRVAVLATAPANGFYRTTNWRFAGTMQNHGRALNLYVKSNPQYIEVSK